MITIALSSHASPPEIHGTDPSQIVEQVRTCRQLTRLKSNVMTLHVMGGPVCDCDKENYFNLEKYFSNYIPSKTNLNWQIFACCPPGLVACAMMI